MSYAFLKRNVFNLDLKRLTSEQARIFICVTKLISPPEVILFMIKVLRQLSFFRQTSLGK